MRNEVRVATYDDEMDTPGRIWIEEDEEEDDCLYLEFEVCVLGKSSLVVLPIEFHKREDVRKMIRMLDVVEKRMLEAVVEERVSLTQMIRELTNGHDD